MKKRLLYGQLSILLVAFWARTVQVQDFPPGIVRDETLNTDIARFIRMGQHALFFREGYGHEPLYHYLTVPFAPLLGDNILATRLPSVFIGLLLVAAVLRWLRRDFGVAVALLGGAVVALSWWPLIFSRLGLRPILEPLLLVAAVYWWRKRPLVAGIFLGLAIYTYTAARVIWLWPLFVLLWLLLQRRSLIWRERPWAQLWHAPLLKNTLIVFVTSLVMYGPLAYILWSDPSLQQRLEQLSGPLEALQQGDLAPVWHNLWLTLGIFSFTGDPLWSYAVPHTPLFGPLVAFFFYIGAAVVLWRLIKGDFTAALLSSWFVVALAPSILAPDAPSLVRLIGLIPVVYAVLAVGVVEAVQYASRRWGERSEVVWAVPTAALIVVILTGWQTLYNGRIWLQAPEVREKYQSIWLDMGRYWDAHPAEALVIADSWYEPIKADSLRLDLGYRPPARWVQNQHALVLPHTAAQFYVAEFAPPHPLLFALLESEPHYRSNAYPSFAVYDLPLTVDIPLLPEPIVLVHPAGGRLSLVGYQFVPSATELQLLSYWQIDEPLPADSSTFLHALDASATIIAQYDGLDAAAATLQPGDRVVQLHTLPAVPMDSTFALGVYTRGDGQRFVQTAIELDFVPLELK